MKLKRTLSTLLIVLGAVIALSPLLQSAYGAYSQWQLDREWNAQATQSHAQRSDAPLRVIGSVSRFFSMRSARADTPSGDFASTVKGSKRVPPIHSIMNRTSMAERARPRIRYMSMSSRRAQALGLVRILIPKIGVRAYVVDGTSNSQLARGPAHFPGSALPGHPGNCAIAGHRNVYGSWFRDLNQLRPGDVITLQTPRQSYDYRVTHSRIVSPRDWSILRSSSAATLTLVTCMVPRARNRLIVFAKKA